MPLGPLFAALRRPPLSGLVKLDADLLEEVGERDFFLTPALAVMAYPALEEPSKSIAP